MISMDIEIENNEEVLCLIDMGFSALQVADAINRANSLDVEILLSELTKENTCKSNEHNELKKFDSWYFNTLQFVKNILDT